MTWERFRRQLYIHTKLQKMKSELIEKCAYHRERISIIENKRKYDTLDFHKPVFDEKLAASMNILSNRKNVEQHLGKMTHSMSGKNDVIEKNQILKRCAKILLLVSMVKEPDCCCIKVKEARMAKYVEGVIARKDLLALITRPQKSTSNIKPKYDISQILHIMGFKRFLIDLIEAPEFIMDYFVSNYNILSIPIGNQHTEQLAEQIQNGISLFFFDTTRFSSTKSRYSSERSLRSGGISEAYLLKESEGTEEKQRTLTLRVGHYKDLDSKLRFHVN